MKILITDPVDQQCVEVFQGEGWTVDFRPGLSSDNIRAAITDADALIVRSQTKVTPAILEAAKQLKVVGRAGAGVDNIDVPAATRRGVIVMNTPGGNTISTAEHTMSLMLALARNIPQANQSLRQGKWDRKSYVGMELFQKTLGVIGLGKVGAEVARRSLGFEMNVIAFDPVLSRDQAAKLGVELVPLAEIFERSDIISVHSPLTAETRNLINEEVLAKCKRGVRIINCARGGIVNEQALLAALQSGQVGGAALDVFETEPPTCADLISHPRVVSTPHLGASTEEAQGKVAIQIAHQVIDLLKGRGISGSVNADAIQIAMRKEIRPYLRLAEKMGGVLAQMMDGSLRSLEVKSSGSLLADSVSALSAGLLKGIFEKVMSEPVNYVNAPFIARERGIEIRTDAAGEHETYSTMLTVAYQTEKERRVFSGTVFGSSDLRIVEIDGYHFEMKPEGNLILYYNLDRPGMLAKVSSILAAANINIGGLSLGRFGTGGKALTIVSTDIAVPRAVLKEIASIEGVSDVRLITI